METANGGGFPQFSRLCTELRLIIWEMHFSSGRIHIIQPATAEEMPEGQARPVLGPRRLIFPPRDHDTRELQSIYLTWKTMDAVTNQYIPSILRLDINKEAYSVARKLRCLDRIPSRKLHTRLWHWFHDGFEIFIAKQGPIDVDWERDLVYVFDPTSVLSLLAAAQPEYARSIRHLAITVPWRMGDPTNIRQDVNLSFSDWVPTVFDSYPRVKTIVVVTLPFRQSAGQGALEVAPVPRLPFPRDAYGFTTVRSFYELMERPSDFSLIVDDTRKSVLLKRAYSGRESYVTPTIIRAVDVDFVHTGSGKYDRRSNGL